jgi:hypothetical protein
VHRAAGVTRHTAHHACIEAVAEAVRSNGIPAGDVDDGTGQPPGGVLPHRRRP